MSGSLREQRMVENEVFFREENESIQKGLDEVNKVAKEHGIRPINFNKKQTIHFNCECSDENCTETVAMTLERYNEIHQERDAFIVKNGHEKPIIEDVLVKKSEHLIVKKHDMPPSRSGKLQPTD